MARMEVVMTRLFVSFVATASVWLTAGAHAENPSSSMLAGELTTLLDSRKLEAFAIESPDAPGRFAAMLYVPGSQILAVSAPSAFAEYLRTAIAAGKHREVYMDLSSAQKRNDRLFVQDLQANGLHSSRQSQEPFDITWRDSTVRTAYDGDWKTQQLSAQDYRDRFSRDEREYVAMLSWFIAGLSK
jgi:hypothetical protein